MHTQKMAFAMSFTEVLEVQAGHKSSRSNALPRFPPKVNENLSIYTSYFFSLIYISHNSNRVIFFVSKEVKFQICHLSHNDFYFMIWEVKINLI